MGSGEPYGGAFHFKQGRLSQGYHLLIAVG